MKKIGRPGKLSSN